MSDLNTIIKNTDMSDNDELRDVLKIMVDEIDRQAKRIKKLESDIKAIHESMPSTARRK